MILDNMSPKLAIDGGIPAVSAPSGPIFPGSMLIDEEEEAAVLQVLRSRQLYRYHGPDEEPSQADQLENRFATHMNVNHTLAVNSGTAALICGLQGVGIGPGDEVIVPAFTWMATATAVMLLGGIPVVAEVDESLTLDPRDVEDKITPYTKAIIVVHMRGVPGHMKELRALATKHNLAFVEDCAQAIGGSYSERRLGSIGDVGCFSLQLSKIITSGEGGMLISNDETIWKRAVMFHDVPGAERVNLAPEETIWGINFRMSELSAAVALVQLTRLDGLLDQLRMQKSMLKSGLKDIANRKGITFRDLPDKDGDTATTLTWFVETPERAQRVTEALQAENINARVLYHPDISDQHVYAHWSGLLNKQSWTAEGGPWRWAKREIEYTPDMCPRSLDLLGRSITINVNPFMENTEMEETVDGIERVLEVLT